MSVKDGEYYFYYYINNCFDFIKAPPNVSPFWAQCIGVAKSSNGGGPYTNITEKGPLGIPFDFTAKPVIAPPQPPRETIQVKAVRPDRDELEIRFPRVQGYRVELPEERLSATFNDDSVLELTPDLVGPSITKNAGIIGEDVDLSQLPIPVYSSLDSGPYLAAGIEMAKHPDTGAPNASIHRLMVLDNNHTSILAKGHQHLGRMIRAAEEKGQGLGMIMACTVTTGKRGKNS